MYGDETKKKLLIHRSGRTDAVCINTYGYSRYYYPKKTTLSFTR